MALKRTQVPFYGKLASRLTLLAGKASKEGNQKLANALTERARLITKNRIAAHIKRGRRAS